MNWKEHLQKLEHNKEWDQAIEFMQNVIEKNPNDMDAYICMNYLLMNLLVEEDYNENKYNYYRYLIKKYFDESYAKFSDNPKYLFFTGITAVMSEWHFGITIDNYLAMLTKAHELEPENLLYRWEHGIQHKIYAQKEERLQYLKSLLNKNSDAYKTLISMGAIGKYLLRIMNNIYTQMKAGTYYY